MQFISEKSKKISIPDQLTPPDGIHVGDGLCFRPRADGGVTAFVISLSTGGPSFVSELTPEEWGKVVQTCNVPADPEKFKKSAPPPSNEELQLKLLALQAQVSSLLISSEASQATAKPLQRNPATGEPASLFLPAVSESEDIPAAGPGPGSKVG